ncbi:MAG: glycosyltransferase [Odoribacter sp.]|nr:glycosyltransferase [Odoribacter sp.]
MKKVAFSVINSICFDQRVLKMAEIVKGMGCEITIIGRETDDRSNSDIIPFKSRRFRMLLKRGFLFYKFFNIRLLFYLLFHKYDLLVANDLDTLLPNYIVSKLKRIPLVYDSHEYFTGVPEVQNRPFVKWVWKTIERSVLPHLKYMITVSEPISSLYEKEYHTRPLVIRNFSKYSSHITPFSREELNVPLDDLLIIIQGTGINIDKGAEELIDAVNITNGVSLLVVGSGDVVLKLKQKVKGFNLMQRVKFIPKVPWEELMKYTRSADAGMCLEKDTNLNYRYSLPNKLFDYISAGIPVVAGFLPESGRIIEENKCGITIPVVSKDEISKALKELKDDPELLISLKKNAVIASESINWENESAKIIELYKPILDSIWIKL